MLSITCRHLVLVLALGSQLASPLLAQDLPAHAARFSRELPDLTSRAIGTASAAPGQAGTMYAVENSGSANLFRIDNYSTNPTVTLIGDTGLDIPALAIDPTSGRLYAVDPTSGYLYQIDANSGAAAYIGDTGLKAAGVVALACDELGNLYAWGQGDFKLYTINKSNGAPFLVGNTGYRAGGDLAFDSDGSLYGSTGTDLIRIDPQTAVSTHIGSFGTTSAVFGLAIGPDGTLYAGDGTAGFFSESGQLYRVNKATAQLTAVGGTLSTSIADLALFGGTPPGKPDLVPYTPPNWSDSVAVSTASGTQKEATTITSDDTLYVSWAVHNNGTGPTAATFYTALNLDGTLLQYWQTPPPLTSQEYAYVKDYQFGPLSAGTHSIQLVPDILETYGPSNNYTKTITVGGAAPASPLPLIFPLKAYAPNRDRGLTPYTARIITVFDHAMTSAAHKNSFWPYGCDHEVVAFTGETGDQNPSPSGAACGDHPGYSQSSGQPFEITGSGNYTGDAADGPTYLNYDGHPGFDFAAALNTQVFAAVSGHVFYPSTANALGLGDPANTFHVLGIIPDDAPSYRVYYLHLSTHPSKSGTKGTFADPSPAPGCPAEVALPIPAGQHVNAGCLVALSGEAGAPNAPHLHFEVHKVINVPKGHSVSSMMQCLADPTIDNARHACVPVDPYGWSGSEPDPYIALTGVASTYLWAEPKP